MASHLYTTDLRWSGSTAVGVRNYDRAHEVRLGEAGTVSMSADPFFRGDARRANPEQLLLAAASSCQLLSFLAVAALAGIDVIGYEDAARAVMPDDASPMRITEIALDVGVEVRDADEGHVLRLVEQAHSECFIAHSLTAEVSVSAAVVCS